MVIFEKNRQKMAVQVCRNLRFPHQHSQAKKREEYLARGGGRGKKYKTGYKVYKAKESPEEQLDAFLTYYIRLHGILFTRKGLESFNAIKISMLRDLDSLLQRNLIESGLLLRLLVMNIFTYHNCLTNG